MREAATDYNFAEFWIVMNKLLLIFTFPMALVAGIFGLTLGIFFVILKLLKRLTTRGPENLLNAKAQFLETLFTFLGFISRADGRVSEYDIARTEHLFRQLRLKGESREKAKRDFKRGAMPGLDLSETAAAFAGFYGVSEAPARMIIIVLISFIIGNGRLDEAEEKSLFEIAESLHMSRSEVEGLLRSSTAGAAFKNSQGSGNVKDHAKAAYQVLGVKPGASRVEVKKAYKRLVSANHPDKMIAQGMPEQVISQANGRMQAIIAAYENVCTGNAWAK